MPLTDLIPWKRSESTEPVRRESKDPWEQMMREMNHSFGDIFRGFDMAPFGFSEERWGAFNPNVDIVETSEALKVSAELPGLDEDDLDITLTADTLTLRGEKKQEHEEQGEGYHRVERSYGSFSRQIPLPCDIDADQVEARFKNGVLTVVLPKSEEARNCKRIQVKHE